VTTVHPAAIALLLLSSNSAALDCACTERTLAAYYADADSVLMAVIESISVLDESAAAGYKVHYRPLDSAWKTPASQVGEDAFFISAPSAGCSLDVQTGAVWILFLERDPMARINRCSGSRALRSDGASADGSGAAAVTGSFSDVPARFVASQLNALAGLDVLQDLHASDHNRLLGLLDIKVLAHGGKVTIHADDSPSAAVIASIDRMEQLQHREASYEYAAAEVYGVSDFGYMIRMRDGRHGWLAQADAGTLFDYAHLVVNRLNYLNRNWHGMLWPDAGAGIPLRLQQLGQSRPARVNATVQVADSLWLQVDVLSSDGCDGSTAKTMASGWTPAWLVDGEPAVWFHSRGC